MTFVIPVSAQNIRSFINGAKTILTHKNKTSSPYSKTINHDNKTINNDTQTVSKANNNSTAEVASTNTQDLSGTWKGQSNIGEYTAYIETYLMKTGDYTYSGVSYTILKKSHDNIPLSDPRVPRRKVLFNATFSNNLLSISEYDTIEVHGMPASLQKGNFELQNDSNQLKLTEVGNKGYELHEIHTSADFPEVYKKYFEKNADQQARSNGRTEDLTTSKYNKGEIVKNVVYTGQKMYINMEIIPEGNDEWKYLANGIFFVDAQNSISGSINSSRSYLGKEWIYPTHQELHGQVKGTYEPQSQELHIQVYNDPNAISDVYDIALTSSSRVKGKGTIKQKDGNIFRSVVGDYSTTNVKIMVSVPVNGNHDFRLVGRWNVAQPGHHNFPVFSNTYVELFANGIGISRNERLNTRKNVKLFNWKVTDNRILNLLGSDYSFTLTNNVLTLKTASSQAITLKRISDDPFGSYKHALTPGTVTGNWIRGGKLKDDEIKYAADSLYDSRNFFYDMHSFTDELGELIQYRFPDPLQQLPLDSLHFLKYKSENVINNGNAKGSLYSFTGMDAEDNEEYYCLQSDGIMILTGKDVSLYLIKVGEPNWNNLTSLHNAYNAKIFPRRIPPPHSHWEECTTCNGDGNLGDGVEEDYTYTNAAGYPVTVTKPKTKKCPDCLGRGGFYVDDLTGKRQAQTMGLFDLF